MTSLLQDDEAQSYEDHLVTWAEYVGELKSRALETMILLETPSINRPTDDHSRVPVSQGNMGPPAIPAPQANVVDNSDDVLHEAIVTNAADLVPQLNVVPTTGQSASQANVTIPENLITEAGIGRLNLACSSTQSLLPASVDAIATTGSCLNVEASSFQPIRSQQPCCTAHSGHTVTTASHNTPRISTAEGSTPHMQLQLAVLAYNTLNDAIENEHIISCCMGLESHFVTRCRSKLTRSLWMVHVGILLDRRMISHLMSCSQCC